MLKRLIQLTCILIGVSTGYYAGRGLFDWLHGSFGVVGVPKPEWIGALLGTVLAILVAARFSRYLIRWLAWHEERLVRIPAAEVMFGALGLIVGLVVAVLTTVPVLLPILREIPLPGFDRGFLPLLFACLFTALLGYLGWCAGYKKHEEWLSLFRFDGDRRNGKESQYGNGGTGDHKILDTSVVIDGRIADICRTGFLDGTLVIPSFVLEELQHIADSSDVLKRNRGRRGLDILNRIQKELDVDVLIYEGDFEDPAEVDSKLIKLAKILRGKVVTNDFNLNKVCELQGVQVLNINDLANAVKPIVLPGEEINVQVIKDGKEHGQGVAYLDDGTMIVIEGGRDHIGDRIDVLVTSVLQTSAGRMIFAKPKLLERVL
ncbi:PIN/TRAM domain-containing protein [Pasteuria penetrans]|nr:PIN/TRAM domain-containing protein [Pasteuria penetrans]